MDEITHEVRLSNWKKIISQCENRKEGVSVLMLVYTGDALEGKMLIAFVALIIRNRMYTKLKDEEERLSSQPNFMNVPAAIRELEKIEMIRQADGVYRLDHAITANQKTILKAFGIDVNQIKRKVQEISERLNPKTIVVKI